MVSSGRSAAASSSPDRLRSHGRCAAELASESPCSQSSAPPVTCGARALQGREQFGCDDDVLRLDHVDAVGECNAGQVGVEERDHAADARHAEPDGQEFRPVRHHQTDRVALADALRQRPARVAVRARDKLAVGEALAVREQRRRVAEFVGQLVLDHDRKDGSGASRSGSSSAAVRSGAPQGWIASVVSRSINPMAIPGVPSGLDSQSRPRRAEHRAAGTGVARPARRQRSGPPNGMSGLSTSAARSGLVGGGRG